MCCTGIDELKDSIGAELLSRTTTESRFRFLERMHDKHIAADGTAADGGGGGGLLSVVAQVGYPRVFVQQRACVPGYRRGIGQCRAY